MTDYSKLRNVGGTIYEGERGFKDPTELAGHLGIGAHEIDWGQIQQGQSSFIKNPQYDPNDPGVKRYIPSGEGLAGLIKPPEAPQVDKTGAMAGYGAPEGIKAAFGEGWQPSEIFKQRGLIDQGITGAVQVGGSPDIFTIGQGGKWIESMDEYEKLFGTRETQGIVGQITPEQAKLLGIKPEGVAELKAGRQKETDMKELFDLAQQAGLSWEEATNLVNSQYPADTAGIREDLGIPDVVGKLFEMPDKTTQEIYQEAYDESELPGVKDKIKNIDDKIAKREADLVKATGEINQNPWLSQASRTGRLRILNELAFADIKNLENQRTSYLDLYDKGIDELEGVMTRGADQYERQRTLYADQLNYLLGEAERRADEAKEERMSEHLRYMPDYLKATAAERAEEKEYERGREGMLSFSEQVELFEKGYSVDAQGNISADISGASVQDIMNAIRQVESGGNYEARGGSGEYGAYQFMPETWQSWSSQYANEVLQMSVAELEMTQENQDAVAGWKIKKLVDQGYNPQEIASIWNSGKPEWKGKIGTNKYGVKYNVPAYVSKIEKALGGVMKSSGKESITDMAKNIIDGFGKISNVPSEFRELVNQEIRVLRDEGYSPQWQEKRMSDKQLVEVNDFDYALDTWGRVKQLAEKLQGQFGPTVISAYDGSMTAFIRQYAKDPEFATLFAEVEKAFQLYRKETTGAQASDKELKVLRPYLPALKERPEIFFSKLNKTMEGTRRAREIYLETLGKGGVDVSQFTGAGDGMSDEEAYQEYLLITGQQ